MTQQESTPGKPPDSKNTLYCSFCGKSQHEVRKLIAGPTVFICDECVDLCMDIIREENGKHVATRLEHVPAACQVLEKEFPWNAGVVPIMSALATNHELSSLPAGRAPRILLSGPTGCGNLEMAVRACEIFGRDFIRLDASSFRASQWRGPRDPFRELLTSVDFNVDRAQRSVVIIDNIDFLCRPDLVAVQEELSSILRGDGIVVAPRTSPAQRDSELLQLSTERITFVLTTHLPYEFEPERGWVTSRLAAILDAKAAVADRLVACGLSSKIVSECTYIEPLRLPTMAEIENYLTNAKSSPVRECEQRLAEMGVTAVFAPAAFQAIAERAEEMNFGLKSLHAIISRLTLRIAFDTGFKGSDQDLSIDGGFIRAML